MKERRQENGVIGRQIQSPARKEARREGKKENDPTKKTERRKKTREVRKALRHVRVTSARTTDISFAKYAGSWRNRKRVARKEGDRNLQIVQRRPRKPWWRASFVTSD